jgi:hypothetical protein
MLAYAAQGLTGAEGAHSSSEVREYLRRSDAALTDLGPLFSRLVAAERLQPEGVYRAFIDVLARDARDAQAAIQLVLAQAAISSQLVDNLNASIHLRALLTDIFLVDEILKLQVVQAAHPTPPKA